MTIRWQPHRTERGLDLVYMWATGSITKAEAEEHTRRTSAGGDLFTTPILIVADTGAGVSPEARQVYGSSNFKERQVPGAIVAPGAPLRVLVSFLLRVSGAAGNTRVFSNQADAVAWLEASMLKPDALP